MDEGATDRSAVWLRRLALAAVVINVVIVVTGGAVRLTGSGLGCPEWPTCEAGRVLPSADTQVPAWQQRVEFGNRALAGVVAAIALATLVAARRRRPRRHDVVRIAVWLLLGVLAQGVIGGITVLTGLHPLIVAAHFLASIALIAAAVVLHDRVRSPIGSARPVIRTHLLHAQRVLLVVVAVVVVLGTLVTASGPHAGDAETPRLGLDPRLISQFHADAVFLLLGLVIALWFALRATDAPAGPCRASTVLLGVVLGQGTIGYVQYFTGLPEVLVGAHMLGACLVWIAALHLWLSSTVRVPATPDPDPAATAHAGSAAA